MNLNLKDVLAKAKGKATGKFEFRWKRKGLKFKDHLKAHNRKREEELNFGALQREAFLIASGARRPTAKDRGGIRPRLARSDVASWYQRAVQALFKKRNPEKKLRVVKR